MMRKGRSRGCGRPNKSALAWLAAVLFAALGTAAYADPATVPFDVYDNYTLDGEIIRAEQNVTAEYCIAACSAENNCIALSFNKWDKACILRKSTGSFAIGASFQSAIRSGTKLPGAADDPILMQCLPNITGPDGGKDIPNVASKEACEDACQNDGECVSFSYSADKYCKTYTSVASLAPKPSSLFGFKTQIHKAEDREVVEQCKTPASAAFDAMLSKPSLDRKELEAAYATCETLSYCTAADRKSLNEKSYLIAEEETAFNAAKGNEDALAAYIGKCKVCEFFAEAQTEIQALLRAREPKAALAPNPEESPKAATAEASPPKEIMRAPNQSNVCKQESRLKSLSFDRKTAISFSNKSKKSITIFWLDYSGNRKSYGTLAPGQISQINTFLSHPWVLADTATGRCLDIYLPSLRVRNVEVRK